MQLAAHGAIPALAGLVIAARGGGGGASAGPAALHAGTIGAWALSNTIRGAGHEVSGAALPCKMYGPQPWVSFQALSGGVLPMCSSARELFLCFFGLRSY